MRAAQSIIKTLVAAVYLFYMNGLAFADCTGGCRTDDSGGVVVHTFTSNGTFTPPPGVTSVEYEVVGGGGGGGGGERTTTVIVFWPVTYDHGGGGGGGGQVRSGTASVQQQDYDVIVGSGGTAGASASPGSSGNDSRFGAITAFGGSGGTAPTGVAGSGGAGGQSGEGHNGGTGTGNLFADRAGGGGGGSGGVGDNASGSRGGDGGSGTNGYGRGGDGGDGAATRTGADASGNTGNGGEGGSGARGGGRGGSGIVIIRYLKPAARYYSRVSGNWSNAATWTTANCDSNTPSSTIPHSRATVVICGGDHVTLDQNATIEELEFANGNSASLTHENGYQLTVGAGGVNIQAVSTGTGSKAWNINDGGAVINGNLQLSGSNNQNRQTLVNLIGGTLDINGNLSFGGNYGEHIAIAATGEAQVYLSGSVAANVRFIPGEESTFTYDGAGNQEVRVSDRINYHNLVLAGSGNKNHNTGAGRSITGTTTVNAGARFNNAASLVYQGDFINHGETVAGAAQTYQGNFINNGTTNASAAQTYRGNFLNTGTFNAGAAIHQFTGSQPQQITGETTFGSLTINNPSGLLINSKVLVQQQLNLAAGVVTTGDNILEVGQPGSAPMVSASDGWVAGNLALYVSSASQNYHYPLGDAAAYRPLALENMNVTAPGYLLGRVSQSAGDHPQIASGALNPDRSVNRWWSLISESVSLSTPYNITFTYRATDLDSGTSPAILEIQRQSGGSWFDVTVGHRNATGDAHTIQARNLSGFGDFAIAEPETSGPGPGPLPSAWLEYRMDEDSWSGSAADVFDSSGNGNHGTAWGGATTLDSSPAVPGDPGTCRYGHFDGDGDYVHVPGLSSVLNGTASMAFWIRTTQVGRSQAWESPGITGVEVEGGTDDIFWGWIDNAGHIGLTVGDDNDTKSTVRINDGAWRHVVLSRDHIAGRYEIYINGVLNTSGDIATGIIGNHYTDIGRIFDDAGSHEHFAGDLDELRIYDSVLSSAEVQALYAETRPCSAQLCPAGVQPGLIGHYYDNQNLSGTPVGTRVDGPINFDWGAGAPGVAGIPANNFSVEWTGLLRITESGIYRFQAVADDGVRLRLNGELIIDQWVDQSATEHDSPYRYLTAGEVYPITLQYYENGGDAVIQLQWRRVTLLPTSFTPIPAGPESTLGAGLYSCAINAISYYGISHSGSGLTCEAEPITITAYDATDNPIAPPAGTELFLSTDPATASWAGGDRAVFDGDSHSVTKYLRQTSAVSALRIHVTDGITSEHPDSPPISFADVGLKFYDSSGRAPVPHQVAGVQDPAVVMRVVQTDTETGACVARLQNTTRPLGLAYECRNPAACSSGETLLLNGGAIPANNAGTSLTYSNVSTNFDADGYAALPFIYSDVGQLRLHGQLALPAEDEDEAITISGSSNEFVVKPYTLAISADSRNPGTTSSGSGFVAAGESFSARIEARNAQGHVTPAFGRESSPAAVQVSHQLLWPSGGSAGALSNSAAFTRTAPGVFENDQLIWDQVGSISLQPALRGDDYLGAGDLAQTPAASGTVGRFYPHEYRLLSGEVSNSCSNFSYMDQPHIEMSYTIQAHGYNMGVVSNYDSALGYGNAVVNAVADNIDDDSVLDRIETGVNSNWSGGLLALNSNQAIFARDADGPDGPFPRVQVGVVLHDPADGRSLVDLDMRTDANGNCPAGSACAAALDGELNLRFGRMRLNSAFGPESADLPADLLTEYWDGSRWRHNSEDSCTAIAGTDILYNDSIPLTPGLSIPIGSGQTETVFHSHVAPNQVRFVGGRALDYFKAPGAGNMGSFTMQVSPTNYPWLTFDWDGNGLHDNGPRAEFNFGSYRGHDRVIYWREIFD